VFLIKNRSKSHLLSSIFLSFFLIGCSTQNTSLISFCESIKDKEAWALTVWKESIQIYNATNAGINNPVIGVQDCQINAFCTQVHLKNLNSNFKDLSFVYSNKTNNESIDSLLTQIKTFGYGDSLDKNLESTAQLSLIFDKLNMECSQIN
jgi:hypothetical protein